MEKVDRDFGNYIAGFVDGEGCFGAYFCERKGRKTPYLVLAFSIGLRADDWEILLQIQQALGCGRIVVRERKGTASPVCIFEVRKIGELVHYVIPFFKEFPLRAKKAAEFQIWKQIVTLATVKRNNKRIMLATIRQLMDELQQLRTYRCAWEGDSQW